MLSHLTEGKLYLEDTTGSVPVSLKDAVNIQYFWFFYSFYLLINFFLMKNFHGGLFTENCFVLGQGSYQDGVFHIEHLGMPPPEPAKVTRYIILLPF